MSRLTDLLRQLKENEPQLAQDLEREVAALADRRAFGLNFERHVPEAVELPGRTVRKGDKVRILPPRGQILQSSDEKLWQVVTIDRPSKTASLVALGDDESMSADLTDLVVVAEFRDPIYPGLVSTGGVERGGDKPFHTVINAENYHALETLLFTHRGRVDVIYIDPPYNTGAKDWKYNNNYVEGDDLYRHSKWLAFMERRLRLARELLNPVDSVLIVTIDEKEYLRLGMLLEQTFPESNIQMVSIAVNPATVSRTGEFGRADEYAYFVMLGLGRPQRVELGSDWITARGRTHRGDIRWDLLRRSGTSGAARRDRPGLFYPIFLDVATGSLQSVGEPIPLNAERKSVTAPAETVAVWPIRQDGSEGRWMIGPKALRDLAPKGFIKIGRASGETTPIYYLKPGEVTKIHTGQYEVAGQAADGSIVTTQGEVAAKSLPSTQWKVPAHDSTQYGARLLRQLLPDRVFPFPKSLYAVEDCLRFFVADKPEAIIVDFFAGSGTTTHAVARLNKQDGGRRQSILVTNNEVAADEQKVLRERGLRPGDSEWEQVGICEYITKPRIEAAISGKRPDGQPIHGDYKFTDEFPMADGLDENVEFFTLTYEAPLRVASNREFAQIAPLLWMRAGAQGRRIDDISAGWDVADTYGVLADLDRTEDFFDSMAKRENAATAYVVTDEDRLFESIAQELPEHVTPVRLYEAYLRNFEIESGRGAL